MTNKEREAFDKFLKKNEPFPDLIENKWLLIAAWEAATKVERKRCIKVCDKLVSRISKDADANKVCSLIATDIRIGE